MFKNILKQPRSLLHATYTRARPIVKFSREDFVKLAAWLLGEAQLEWERIRGCSVNGPTRPNNKYA